MESVIIRRMKPQRFSSGGRLALDTSVVEKGAELLSQHDDGTLGGPDFLPLYKESIVQILFEMGLIDKVMQITPEGLQFYPLVANFMEIDLEFSAVVRRTFFLDPAK